MMKALKYGAPIATKKGNLQGMFQTDDAIFTAEMEEHDGNTDLHYFNCSTATKQQEKNERGKKLTCCRQDVLVGN